jgi:hypothetical protein
VAGDTGDSASAAAPGLALTAVRWSTRNAAAPDTVMRCCRHYFALFLWLETGAIAVSAAVAMARLRQGGHRFSEGNPAITWTAVFLVIDVFLLLSVGALSVTQVRIAGQPSSWAGGPPCCAPGLSMCLTDAALG